MTRNFTVDELLTHSNLNSHVWPWNGVAHGMKKRWKGTIPVKTNGVARAEQALDRIESKLGKAIFDRSSIAVTPDHQIARGVVVSVGTAVAPEMDEFNCGNVGKAPASYEYPPNFVNPNTGEISTVLYVNLGSALCDDCKQGQSESDIAVHEFGHAMGLGPHFWGYGDGPIISERFWEVLTALYSD